ncbi:thiomuracin/GE37468 family thiazolyl RiPP peptide [Streptomonospora wellingtoniae]|uniref:GE37468 family thiazolyl peptide n=1 Tax=Streptomonospora wellingtoniae TaxID=3075544 RepID=A0ABU2KX23_9ACTN|nr:thiomuracin/GE37468 family thiazolyl RiPP peptide [Streptomonospora sp. DSM 45055]MDT0303593.1 GE37468 family thiazolyl peptide [Streptomonospora sp. DSM 45055]
MQSQNQSTQKVDFEVDDLPMDVFSLTSKGLTVESLTSAHGLPDNGASGPETGGSCSPGGCVSSSIGFFE